MRGLINLAMALDPVELARAAGIEPDPWQSRLLRSSSPRLLLNCSRQSGKSTASAVLACHTAIYEPKSLTLLLSPSQRQSGELFRCCLDIYHALDKPVEADSETILKMELHNGSRIVSLPGKEATIRGLSGVSLLIIDESARVPDALYMAVRPMLAVSGGRLVLLSTPYGSRGFFWGEWKDRAAWDYYEIPASQCPRISPTFLAEERRKMGAWWFEQEYCCSFKDAQDAAFRSEDLEKVIDPEVEQWNI